MHAMEFYTPQKNTYALKTPHTVALPFIYGVEYIIISNQKRENYYSVSIEVFSACVSLTQSLWSFTTITAGIFIAVQPHLSIKLHQAKKTSKAFLDLVTLTFDLRPWSFNLT